MRAIAVYEAKGRFTEMITVVEKGAPVAKLLAVNSLATNGQRQQVQAAMQRLRCLGGADVVGFDVKAAIGSGRD